MYAVFELIYIDTHDISQRYVGVAVKIELGVQEFVRRREALAGARGCLRASCGLSGHCTGCRSYIWRCLAYG